MTKVKQHPYMSPEAVRLRQRDSSPPWGVHPCEVDSIDPPGDGTAFHAAWVEAVALRQEIERSPNT